MDDYKINIYRKNWNLVNILFIIIGLISIIVSVFSISSSMNDFNTSIDSVIVDVNQGSSTHVAVEVHRELFYSKSVSLRANSVSPYIHMSFEPSILKGESDSVSNLTIFVDNEAKLGEYLIPIVSTGADGKEHGSKFKLNVLPVNGSAPTTEVPITEFTPLPEAIGYFLKKYNQETQIMFETYGQMKVGEAGTVKVLITDETSKNISNLIEKNELFKSRNINVVPEMEIKLIEKHAGSFRIIPITNEKQYVGGGVTEWDWAVTPQSSGEQTLILCVNYIIFSNSDSSTDYERYRSSVKLIEEDIDVKGSFSYFVESHWEGIIGIIIGMATVIIGIAGLEWKKNKQNGKRE